MSDYENFLAGKGHRIEAAGFDAGELNPLLYPFQRDIVRWAVKQGRAAIFADCGMGKSFMQLEWAREVQRHTGGVVLIVAPIAVGQQTIDEALKLNLNVCRVEHPEQLRGGICITNYERLHHFVGAPLAGIVLDESSILKSVDGKTRTMLLREFSSVPYRLCCTATPAPNDVSELANHAEFLGAMSRVEMLATFFVHDSDDGEWRLKGHAAADMWRWIAQWGVFVRRPSDLGYPDQGWALPPLTVRDEVVPTGLEPVKSGVGTAAKVRKASLPFRAQRAADVINAAPAGEHWIVWCDLNAEEETLAELLGDRAVVINGQHDEQERVERLAQWKSGAKPVLISKARVFGWGLNFQHCARVMFLGLGHSYELFYQAVRRSWRFGQTRAVEAVIVTSDIEEAVADNVKRKEAEAHAMAESIVKAVKDQQSGIVRTEREDKYEPRTEGTENWALMLGDCVDRIREVPDRSVGLTVFSPPFASLYTYSASRRDMGNCRTFEEFFEHFKYLIPELKRVLMPGRRAAVHCQQLSTTKATHGYIGWRDFRGDLIRAFTAGGFIYDGEICIDKNPQAQAIRTKSKQLMFVQKNKDSSWVRPAMADYILLFRHPEECAETPVKTDVSNEEWILFAHPIWYGIRESNVLRSYRDAREDEDEKHICPLQLETIERVVRLWSNPGEVVLSPFAGIGSEGYVSRRFGRQFIGIELKDSYWRQAVENLKQADAEGLQQPTEAVGLADIKAKQSAA